MSQDEQATPTPRTDSTIGADKFVPAWKVRKDMGQLERELSAAKVEAFELSLNPDIAEYAALRAEAERLREERNTLLATVVEIIRIFAKHDPKGAAYFMESLVATRKDSSNG